MQFLYLNIGFQKKKSKKNRISLAYSRVVVYKRQFDRRILAHLYNAMALSHYLYLSPFWRIFQKEDKKELRSTYYEYAEYLLRLQPWTVL